MSKIQITHNCLVEGKAVSAGEILEELDPKVASVLLVSGRAKVYQGESNKEAPKKAAKKASKKKSD